MTQFYRYTRAQLITLFSYQNLGKLASGFGILGFEILESGIQHKEYRIQLSTTMSYGKRVSRG